MRYRIFALLAHTIGGNLWGESPGKKEEFGFASSLDQDLSLSRSVPSNTDLRV